MNGIIDPIMDEDGSHRARSFAAIVNSMVYGNVSVGQIVLGGLLGLEAIRQFIRVSDRYALRATAAGINIGGHFVEWGNVSVVERQITSNGAPHRIAIRYKLDPEGRLRAKLFRTLDFGDMATQSFLELAEEKGKLTKVLG
jgi:hypothetical protein